MKSNRVREILERKSEGLGDTVDKVTELTGIKSVVNKIEKKTGRDCGCNKRKDWLNDIMKYKF